MKARWRRFVKALGSAFSRLFVLLTSAPFWFLVLGVVGVSATSLGVGMQYGAGNGVLALGVLCLGASELLRRGMMRA